MTTLLFAGIGGSELLVILLVVLLIFGGKKIPELMRGLGRGVKEYKNAINEVEKADEPKKEEENK